MSRPAAARGGPAQASSAAWLHARSEFTSAQPGLIANCPLQSEPVAVRPKRIRRRRLKPQRWKARLEGAAFSSFGSLPGAIDRRRNAVTFAPDEEDGSDVFAFQYKEFPHPGGRGHADYQIPTRTYQFVKASAGIDPTKPTHGRGHRRRSRVSAAIRRSTDGDGACGASVRQFILN